MKWLYQNTKDEILYDYIPYYDIEESNESCDICTYVDVIVEKKKWLELVLLNEVKIFHVLNVRLN